MNWFSTTDFDAQRRRMVREQLSGFPAKVIAAMGAVPRHEFLPEESRALAYEDRAVPIGFGQTISQPYVVAFMTAQLNPQPTDRILEIGTGSGYQAAVLARLVAEVFTMEIIAPLAQRAGEIFRRLAIRNIRQRPGDGSGGWPEAAPFAGVMVTCAPETVPAPLAAQLRDGGRMLIPVGPPGGQNLFVLQKRGGKLTELARLPVRFVPMTGATRERG